MTGRYVEVNMDENNELIRMTCPVCQYPMRVLAKHENNVYQCYCACCQTDRYMKDTLDVEKLTFKEFDKGMKRGKGIDLERISDLVYDLYNEKEQLKKERKGFESCSHNWNILYDEAKNKVEELSKENKELKKENKQLKRYIKNSYMGSVCDNCEHCKEIHTNDWFNGIVYDAECEKGHMDMDISDCEDFKLTSKVFKE